MYHPFETEHVVEFINFEISPKYVFFFLKHYIIWYYVNLSNITQWYFAPNQLYILCDQCSRSTAFIISCFHAASYTVHLSNDDVIKFSQKFLLVVSKKVRLFKFKSWNFVFSLKITIGRKKTTNGEEEVSSIFEIG